MPFFWDWVWEKLSGVSKTAEKPQSVGRAEMDNQVGQKIVRDGGALPTKESNPSSKPRRVRSNDTSKTARKSPRKTVCAAASKNKAKGKVIPKG
jgi:hypothetical protein